MLTRITSYNVCYTKLLRPEEVYQLDGEINYTHPVIDFTIAGFYSYFSHYIFANPTGDFNNDVGAGQVFV